MIEKMPPSLSSRQIVVYFIVATVSFQLAFEISFMSFMICVYAFYLLKLSEVITCRFAFCMGTLLGVVNYSIQLSFFWNIFGPFAIALWILLALFIGTFVALTRFCRLFVGKKSLFFIPFLWMGIEYFRSELYPLKFAWLTLSGVFAHNPEGVFIRYFGYYGVGLTMIALACMVDALKGKKKIILGVIILGVLSFLANRNFDKVETNDAGPFVIGLQFESASTAEIQNRFNAAINKYPQADLLVLSEYAFGGEIPKSLRNWCRTNKKYLIAGGSESSPNAIGYYNTAFVVGPDGEVVFKQAKSVPVQFFDDGLPAQKQELWNSPWGKIGICICYDLSFSRVTDELVRQGARMLVVPTFDAESWGKQEHFLHARIAPLKASEYHIPIARVCSSGISQLVSNRGFVLAKGSYPGQGDLVAEKMILSDRATIPMDRLIALLSAIISCLICCTALSWGIYKRVFSK